MRQLVSIGAALAALLVAAPAQAADPDWMMPEILQSAKAEGSVTVYSSVNESEALPQWKLFEQATGIKVNYVRASDAQLNGRVAVEYRAGQPSWDLIISSAASQLNQDVLAKFEVPEVRKLMENARDKNGKWYGVSAYYNTPAYNTKLIPDASALPKSYDDFAQAKQWRGKVAIDTNDTKWLAGMFRHYGEDRARKMMLDLVANLQPTIIDGHLPVARGVGSGEYALALSNYTALTHNVQLSGAPTDIFVLDPVVVFMHQLAFSARAPHPNAARLAANFILSQEAQAYGAKTGRSPTRPDVQPNPPDAVARLMKSTIIPIVFTQEDDRKWKRTFDEIFRPR